MNTGLCSGVHDGVSLTVELTPDELERLEFRADERGIDFHSLFEPADLKRPRLNGCLLTLVISALLAMGAAAWGVWVLLT